MLKDGAIVALAPLADRVTERYCAEYPDEAERYGPAGRAWCVHDNLYLFAWAFGQVCGDVVFDEQVRWLAHVLHSRDFPLERLAHDLRIAAEVVVDADVVEAAPAAAVLRDGALAVERYRSAPHGPPQR
jgi:hypothetical protein